MNGLISKRIRRLAFGMWAEHSEVRTNWPRVKRLVRHLKRAYRSGSNLRDLRFIARYGKDTKIERGGIL